MAAGVPPFDAWELTWGECIAILRAADDAERDRLRFLASCAWKNADLTAQSVAPMLARNARRPQSLHDSFPGLFEEEMPSWMRVRDNMLKFAEVRNAQLKG